jgi:hypothetical protein
LALTLAPGLQLAKGYQPEGTYGLKPATAIHWSAEAGSASVITTGLTKLDGLPRFSERP